jgi:mannan endo-1,4-beta-mannosidase
MRTALGGLSALIAARLQGHSAAAHLLQAPDPAAVAIGAYLPDAIYDPAVLVRFSAKIGRAPDFLIWYQGWAEGDFGDEQRDNLRRLDEWGITPVIAWDPFDPAGPPIDQPAYALANIIRGDFDDYIDNWARGLAAYGKPIFLNFGHEMNGNWLPWGIGVNGNQPGEFVAAWRHVHDRFTALGTTNVIWVWTPNEMYEDVPATVEEVYPGDDYVDWFGMNGFNWGADIHWKSCDCQSAWRTFNEIFANTYDRLVALADKPIMIGEVASSEVGGDKAAWITDAFLEQIPSKYPQIRAVSWFNKVATGLDTIAPGVVEPTTTSVDWRVTSSRAALKAFSDAVAQPYYQGSLVAFT